MGPGGRTARPNQDNYNVTTIDPIKLFKKKTIVTSVVEPHCSHISDGINIIALVTEPHHNHNTDGITQLWHLCDAGHLECIAPLHCPIFSQSEDLLFVYLFFTMC